MEPVPQAVPKGTRHGAYHDSGSDLCDSDTDSPPDSEGNAAAAVSIATKYGLSPDVILRPEAPDVVMRKLGLQEVYEFYGGEAEAKPLEEALHSAFGPLLVYFGISILVDPLRPEGKAYREHLRLREPEGPMAIGSANGKGHQVAGGFVMVLMYDLLQQNLMGQGHPGAFEWLLSWANRRAATICEWLQRQYAALEAEHPAELAELKGIQAPRELEFVSTRGRFGEALPPESVCRLQCQGTLLPPDSVLAERALVYWVAALARAVDGEFQRRVQRVVAEYETMHNAEVKYTQVAPKTVQRMLNKLEGDHEKLEPPRPGSNADGCRCGLVIELAHTPGLLAAIAAEFGRNGGGVVRVKNGMALSADEAEAAFGYRAILTNYQCVCEGVTYADVLRHFEAVLAEFGLQESGGPGSRQGELHKVSHWLEEEGRGSQNVTFLTETQAMLPLYAESRKLSHWPYKFLRCQAAGASSSPLQSFMMDLMTLNCD